MVDSSSTINDDLQRESQLEKENSSPKDASILKQEQRSVFGDSHSIQITSFRLNGSNYLRWSQSVQMYIRGRGKIGYLTGDRPQPNPTDPQYAAWDAENSMVMTWLVNSMEEDISSNYLCYSTAKELWDSVTEMYSDLGNKSQIYELTLKAREIRQGNDNVTKYFHSLKRVWQDLDLFNTYKWKSTEDAKHHQQTVEEGRIFQFLAGLNEELDEVRGRIIGRATLPSLGEIFAEVRREETRRSVMMGKTKVDLTPPETNALIAESTAFKSSSNQRNSSSLWCDHCNKPRHTRETCWKLNGRPAHLKGSKTGPRAPRAFPTAHEAEKSTLNKEQVEELIRLLKSSSLSGIPNASLAQTGWISIGSLDGFVYSFSPTGVLKKFSRRNTENSIVQVGPFLDCSGFAVYSSQIEMEGKVSRTIGEYTIVSAIRPKAAIFTMLVPATGSIYWSEGYPGQLSTLLSKSDLSQFVVNEEILLTFLAASKVDTPLQCRTIGQKLASSCSQARTKLVNIYSGNERTIVLFLLFESALLVVLIGLVRFCCTFWAKRKLKDHGLGSFLDKRCSLQLQKKALERTITELEKKAAEEAVDNEVIEKLGDVVRKKECIERKLSTTYSLGRDKIDSHTESMLPLHMGKTRSYSFQGGKQQKLTMFHTLSDTSFSESSSEGETSMFEAMDPFAKVKAKTPMEEDTSSNFYSTNPLDVT